MSCQAEPVEARLIQNHIAFNKLPEIIGTGRLKDF
jgi:hypothetical protein